MTSKPPTTTELLREIHKMQTAILQNTQDIISINEWRRLDDATKRAAKEAVDEYRKANRLPISESKINRDFVKVVLAFLGIIASLVYIIQTAKP